ncbi:hypothetical protein CHLNCDRAFT_26559 [Chlorella variabilis]|uniref:Cupin 2 conserved barrel domain-containing protein n=1 Tax=Chlorella variabilis TaxID=554065 RepID=E1ZNK1_CHLVA|nr:hypothetical protein CHLNCDRAFT_26559 [Chlorella variabilis]EFN52696.1 hypothetical protein CHLNCDRAFT_26559 [Chlorella variabilis]|eukprot:XP_005844798.1 hypothetical protein CHLNCDRAFT_26559 [Chlorella variabilis]
MRTFEVFQQTFAPGAATPIHEHACNEVFLVMRGEGTAFIRDKASGASAGSHQSTFNILPGARHQLVNTGAEDFQALVVTDNPPFRVGAA